MRIAFFGGSFDPPHNGHLAVAEAARQALTLDQVLFAPVGLQPLKRDGSSASFEDRVAMTRLAIAGEASFEISLADAPNVAELQKQPNYTIDTLLRLRRTLPANAELFLLLGADAFRLLRRWHRAAEIPFAASLILASRPKEDLSDLVNLLPATLTSSLVSSTPELNEFRLGNPAGDSAQLYLLPNLHYDISATELRDEINAGQAAPLSPLLPPAVLGYIHRHRLYI